MKINFNMSDFEDADLKNYHDMMMNCAEQGIAKTRIGTKVWSLVAKELLKRGLIRIIGSVDEAGLDDPGNCVTTKNW
jgi:hypothetical protein